MGRVLEKAVRWEADDTLPTPIPATDETVIFASPTLTVPTHNARINVRAWICWTTGTGTTAAIVRLREGNGLSGAIVNQAVVQSLVVAAGLIDAMWTQAAVEVANVQSVQYTLTIAQVGATANGLLNAAALEVEVLN